jgi:arginine decarboxylase
MVPGQVITIDTIDFMRKLDVKEIHGFSAALGLKLLKPSFLEAAGVREVRPPSKEKGTVKKQAA